MSNSRLVSLIREAIQKEGPLPFVRFMERALYHPEYGYYPAPRQRIGPQGDYDTSPSVHPVFAELLTRQMTQMIEGQPTLNGDLAIIEFGAGDGILCCEIVQCIEATCPSLFQRLHYIIIETSPSFRERQRERLLPRYAHIVRWEDQMPLSCTGVVLSNELLDAFPVHRLRLENGSVYEIYVDWKDRFVEIVGPPSSERLLDYMKNIGLSAAQIDSPMEIEINLNALDWIGHVGNALKSGFVITIDYGYSAQQLYTPRRRRGTLLCYRQHQVYDNPYDFIGEQDMTSHVDFTALAQAGETAGLSTFGLTDQTHFLMGLGITEAMQREADKMEQSETARKNFLAMKYLIAPHQMGKTFKVLIQGKGVASDTPLNGLTFPAFPKDYLTASIG